MKKPKSLNRSIKNARRKRRSLHKSPALQQKRKKKNSLIL